MKIRAGGGSFRAAGGNFRAAGCSPLLFLFMGNTRDRFKASNYRPVSLTSLCCKLQEHIITSNVLSHLERHKILTDCQHGFRARRTCETQLLTLVHELAETLDTGGQTDLVILDFSKAFDRVPHRRLLEKLNHYGIRGQTHGWIKSFLSGRTQQVIVDGATSEKAPVRALTRILKTGIQDSHLAKSRSPTAKSGSPTPKKLESHQFVHTIYLFHFSRK